MRIIEPHQLKAKKPKRKRTITRDKRLIAAVLLFSSLGLVAWLVDNDHIKITPSRTAATSQAQKVEPEKPRSLRIFSADEFRDLYSTLAYPNTQELIKPPIITGDLRADERIRDLAESRGYRLRSIPIAPIMKTGEPNLEGDDLLQPLALSAWQDLKRQAVADNIPLRLLSGYRSVDYQRIFFVERLFVEEAYAADIANGLSDPLVVKVLSSTAPPGYSRHHTGYAIDLSCHPNEVFVEFATSVCYEWISKNNYEIAKKHGWVPSYPAGTTEQGPEAEAWEYVWVGKNAVLQR